MQREVTMITQWVEKWFSACLLWLFAEKFRRKSPLDSRYKFIYFYVLACAIKPKQHCCCYYWCFALSKGSRPIDWGGGLGDVEPKDSQRDLIVKGERKRLRNVYRFSVFLFSTVEVWEIKVCFLRALLKVSYNDDIDCSRSWRFSMETSSAEMNLQLFSRLLQAFGSFTIHYNLASDL